MPLAQIVPYDEGPKYRSDTERLWAKINGLILMSEIGMMPILTKYEPMKFSIPSGVYTPDFLHQLPDLTLLFIEVKGSKKQKGYARARAALKNATTIYPLFRWAEVVKLPGENFSFERMGSNWDNL